MINIVLKNKQKERGEFQALDEELENIYVTFLSIVIL